MMRITAVLASFAGLGRAELAAWVERGWVRPDVSGTEWVFHEIDVARVRLIHDLRFGMDVREDAIPLVLSLLDQVYELRESLQSLLRAIEAQPTPVRDAIQQLSLWRADAACVIRGLGRRIPAAGSTEIGVIPGTGAAADARNKPAPDEKRGREKGPRRP